MTREEAIAYIKEWRKDKYALNGSDIEVLDMAIEALSKPTYGDLISRADAINAVGEAIADGTSWYDAINALPSADAPTIDAVEVVRCGECKHMISDGRCMEFADDGIRPSATDFCSYGERKGGDDE